MTSYRARLAAPTMRARIHGPSASPAFSAARTAASYSACVSRTDTTLPCGFADGGRPTGFDMSARIAPTETVDNREFSAYGNSHDHSNRHSSPRQVRRLREGVPDRELHRHLRRIVRGLPGGQLDPANQVDADSGDGQRARVRRGLHKRQGRQVHLLLRRQEPRHRLGVAATQPLRGLS